MEDLKVFFLPICKRSFSDIHTLRVLARYAGFFVNNVTAVQVNVYGSIYVTRFEKTLRMGSAHYSRIARF